MASASLPRALEPLGGSQRLDRATIDRFLEKHRFPLQAGRETTFVYRGKASSVRLRAGQAVDPVLQAHLVRRSLEDERDLRSLDERNRVPETRLAEPGIALFQCPVSNNSYPANNFQ